LMWSSYKSLINLIHIHDIFLLLVDITNIQLSTTIVIVKPENIMMLHRIYYIQISLELFWLLMLISRQIFMY